MCVQYLVSLHTGSEQAEAQGQLKAAVEAAGGFVCSYVPDHTFRIMLPAAEVQQLALLQGGSTCCSRAFACLARAFAREGRPIACVLLHSTCACRQKLLATAEHVS